ncbi:intermembrane phospholipid transport protein YdbH family protein [Croceibacterium ferulae]|uniref:intermembrane phospholipid transport protein YdbH family protein n=1 Tax=Croceibacterium ferulae TaxID=1854641 RepID=UPI000EAB5130|nr:YdbH domain-containing protein [Croceibacterium ferulae]
MADDVASDPEAAASPEVPPRGRIGCWAAVAMLVFLLGSLLFLWLSRERIAGDIITDLLDDNRIQATYRIESIGPRQQVLADVVVGDPARPDLTVERIVVRIGPRLGTPALESVRLIRPRLYGTYTDGQLSFGALDPLLFEGERTGPFTLPDLRLAVEDGRGLLTGNDGRLGISLAGSGWLRDGWTGEIAAITPRWAQAGCTATDASLYGRLSIRNARPHIAGPLRLGRLACPDAGIALAGVTAPLDVTAEQALDGFSGRAQLASGATTLPQVTARGTEGTLRFTWRKDALTADYQLTGTQVQAGGVALASLALEGALRTRGGLQRVELEADASAAGIALGSAPDRALAGAQAGTRNTLLYPLLGQMRRTLARETPGSTLTGNLIARRVPGADDAGEPTLTLLVPSATLRGGSGDTLLRVSRVQLVDGGGQPLRWSGNMLTGGDLPRINARVEQARDGGLELVGSMAPWRVGDSSLAVPRLTLAHAGGGSWRFAGAIQASGALPGGSARNLQVPLDGTWSRRGGLAMWRGCTDLRFDALAYANLALDRRRLTLCPPRGVPILRLSPGGRLAVAAGAPALQLTGRLGETPIAIDSGPVGFAWPGTLTARAVTVALGPRDTATRFVLTGLTAQLGQELGGTFAGTDVLLNAVPLDIRDGAGTWRYAGGQLTLADGSFRLEDRAPVDRFNPLVARGATLSLLDNRITADALLREPASDRAITRVAIAHDLATGAGRADLAVDRITFDKGLQPVTLTPLALGVVADVAGDVTGDGLIEWNETGVSSTGTFTTDDLDLAAAFGPVTGASGTIAFADLLGLTTAPDQVLRIATVNPGIEVVDGVIRYALRNGEALTVHEGQWPFFGGRLVMQPVTIRFGVPEVRRYTFEITGLDAARFVTNLGMSNLSATGTFDGTMPIVFDAAGNGQLAGGLLVSNAPGGNVSYVGELTYEDLSPIVNFAFDSLRSLDYEKMSIQLDGSLTGEIVTRVSFDGISQGEGASSNFIIRKLASLPLRFIVNVRAPFLSLIGSVRSLYDPTAIRDPRTLGLLPTDGNSQFTDGIARPDPIIQPSESEPVP